jgi:uncharacterized protein (TIGR02611 family)
MRRVRERKARHRQRGRAFRVLFALGGFVVIAVGLVLVPLPGPGWLVVAVGLGMLALEFDRAERLLEVILERLERATGASRSRQLAVAGLTAAAVVTLAAAALLWDIPLLPV